MTLPENYAVRIANVHQIDGIKNIDVYLLRVTRLLLFTITTYGTANIPLLDDAFNLRVF